MTDLRAVNTMHAIRHEKDNFTGPVTERELLPPNANIRYVIHTIVASSDDDATIAVLFGDGAIFTTEVERMFYPAQGGIALEDIYFKVTPGLGVYLTTTGAGEQSIFAVYHVEPI